MSAHLKSVLVSALVPLAFVGIAMFPHYALGVASALLALFFTVVVYEIALDCFDA